MLSVARKILANSEPSLADGADPPLDVGVDPPTVTPRKLLLPPWLVLELPAVGPVRPPNRPPPPLKGLPERMFAVSACIRLRGGQIGRGRQVGKGIVRRHHGPRFGLFESQSAAGNVTELGGAVAEHGIIQGLWRERVKKPSSPWQTGFAGRTNNVRQTTRKMSPPGQDFQKSRQNHVRLEPACC